MAWSARCVRVAIRWSGCSRDEVYAVHRAGRQAQLATGAQFRDYRVHQLRRADDRVHRAGLDALGAADALGLAHQRHLWRLVHAVRWIDRPRRAPEQFRERAYTGLATGRALVDAGLAARDCLRVGLAAGVAALRALRLRQQRFDARGERVQLGIGTVPA